MSGPIADRQMCEKNAGCKQLRNISAKDKTPLRCMWQHGLFWRHAGQANGEEG
jgi:hypothetical protein